MSGMLGGIMKIELDACHKTEMMDEGFKDFMENDLTKLVLSMIPSSDNPDAVKSLLRECFSRGASTGESIMMRAFVMHAIEGRKEGPRGPVKES